MFPTQIVPSLAVVLAFTWVPAARAQQFVQQGAQLTGGGAIGVTSLGYAVAISADGNTAIVGGSSDNGSVGAAWVWTRSGSVWTQQRESWSAPDGFRIRTKACPWHSPRMETPR